MRFSNDLKSFIDGDCLVPFYVRDCHYYIKHKIQDDYFEHEFKIYYKNCNRYFIGIKSSNLVRQITAQDYNIVLEDKRRAEERTNAFLNSAQKVKERLQLTLF
ncbi:MAG: hypothetical protein PHQ93_06140 [Sulfurimonas sp.]|uniref:hypothetical protein n=1 Tax=Sulfurimonas sp. TaxID=2022749 RepID=UPI00260BEF38|nr:hypothetical protein [Sulfurimonas sp.]MDD5400745.1 hypothetical protein [Sulfurimonas sp.]